MLPWHVILNDLTILRKTYSPFTNSPSQSNWCVASNSQWNQARNPFKITHQKHKNSTSTFRFQCHCVSSKYHLCFLVLHDFIRGQIIISICQSLVMDPGHDFIFGSLIWMVHKFSRFASCYSHIRENSGCRPWHNQNYFDHVQCTVTILIVTLKTGTRSVITCRKLPFSKSFQCIKIKEQQDDLQKALANFYQSAISLQVNNIKWELHAIHL